MTSGICSRPAWALLALLLLLCLLGHLALEATGPASGLSLAHWASAGLHAGLALPLGLAIFAPMALVFCTLAGRLTAPSLPQRPLIPPPLGASA